MTTESILAHHLQAILQADVDGILSDYTDQSVFFTPNGPIHDLAGIRGFFTDFLHNSPPALLSAILLVRQDVVADVAYIIWQAEPFIPLASDTFVVRDNKIVAQTFVALAPSAMSG